ncbi:MAG: SurA N-terminal domain-containing protein [Alphaproteobacteria bacterium]|nr:SurA N-terminal domain-containing protein [Alphaproteobacteria bacterium]
MINKLAKAQKSWVAKLILSLTALSFMSLFGITGYLSSASNNRTVIKVDNIEISQSEFQYELQKELNAAKNILNTDLDEEAMADLRASLTSAVASKMVKDAVIDRSMQKYHVLFRPELISRMIANEPSFQDLSGNFNRDLFRRVLNENNISEQEYLKSVSRALAEQILTAWPVQKINIPEILVNAEIKIDGKRRVFKYTTIEPENIKIDRDISEDEITQYYEDFAAQFVEPERRNLSVIYLSVDDIAKNMEVTKDEIKAYYDEHIDDYETKEKREVLQMMFEDQSKADEAYEALTNGADFYEVAADFAGQSKEDTELGSVFENDLVFEIAEDTFALEKGGFTKPIAVSDVFQIIKVVDITEPSKVDYSVASEQIKKELVSEKLYDAVYDVLSKMEDQIGAGKTLEEIAGIFNTKLQNVEGLADDGSVLGVPENLAQIVKSSDFIDAAFSYAKGETSQTIETDEGLLVMRIDDIAESHQKSIEEVTPQIKTLWADSERTAIVQEMVNDIVHDLEEGDDFTKTAQRFGLHVYKSQPITRNETFADLSYQDVRELFAQELNTPYQTNVKGQYVVVIGVEDFQNSVPLSEDEMNMVRFKVRYEVVRDLQKAMLDSYAKDYKTKIKYKLMGIMD